MSAEGVVISCVAGAATFAVLALAAPKAELQDRAQLLLCAKLALFVSVVFFFLAFWLTGLLSDATPMQVLLADLPSRQKNKLIYFAYGSFTVAILVTAAWLWRVIQDRSR